MTIRVFLVDDHGLFRSGVRAELDGSIEVVGEASTAVEAIEGIDRTRPDVVLLDVHLPTAAVRRWSAVSATVTTSRGSWPCRCRTRPTM